MSDAAAEPPGDEREATRHTHELPPLGVADETCAPRPASDADLGFERRPMVRWLDPHQLLGTAARVLASGFSTSYNDSREQQAHLPGSVVDRSAAEDVWIDYASDLGDGWNSTYTVAWLLAQERLEFADGDQVHRVPRGDIVVLGGDQVYPVPTRREYENRFLGPYRAALPGRPPGGAQDLFAIPGSHDWYDGLVNFTSVFCRQRAIGGRQTSQTRSYVAVRLPHGWWMWGIDLQFGDYLDEAQLAYFAAASREAERGDRFIVCMAKEVESGRRSAEVCSDRNLAYLEREIIAPAGGRVALYLKSGRHYYARYESADGCAQLVTAGGGGAFLHPTHALPESLQPPAGPTASPYRLATTYPSAAHSRRLRKRVWLLPAFNLPLAVVLGAIQVLVVFMLGLHLDNRHRGTGFGDLIHALWEGPTAFLVIIAVIVIFGAMIRLAHDASGLPRLLIGLGHSALQFGGLALVIVVASELSGPVSSPALSLAVFLGLVWVLGGIGGVLGVSGYLWFTNCFGFHANEAYAPLHHADQKNFLRIHIAADGTATLYGIGVERVCKRWRFRPDALSHEPWLAPAGVVPAAHLIEPPVSLR